MFWRIRMWWLRSSMDIAAGCFLCGAERPTSRVDERTCSEECAEELAAREDRLL